MAGNTAGGKLSAERILSNHGPDYYKKLGALGGRVCVPKGFGRVSRRKRQEAGRKGGTISKRRPGKRSTDASHP